MVIQHLALISNVPIDPSELARVSAAIQKQVLRDVAPIWNVEATISAFPTFDDVPAGYWPVIIVDEAPQPGSHSDRDGHPMAFVEQGPTWSLRASHEVIEMLVDSTGKRTVPGYAPAGDGARVEFLMEVCDPCQDPAYMYTVDGVMVSDFCTPEYYSPATNQRYSYSGRIERPFSVLPGGYLSWRDPVSRIWYQMNNTGSALPIKTLGVLDNGPTGFRVAIDAQTPGLSRLSRSESAVAAAHAQKVAVASRAQAERWKAMLRR